MTKLYGHARTDENHYFILENGIKLNEFLGNADLERRRNIMKDISEATYYLLESDFCFSHLKSQDVINSQDVIVVEGHDGFRAKLCCLHKLLYFGNGAKLSNLVAFQVGWSISITKDRALLKTQRALVPLFTEIIGQWGDTESADLIGRLANEPGFRLMYARLHPFFWDEHKRMRFLRDASSWLFDCGKIATFERTDFRQIFDKTEKDGWAKKVHPDIRHEVDKGLTANFTIKRPKEAEKKISYLVKSIRNIDAHFRTVTTAADAVLSRYLQPTNKAPDLTVGACRYFASTFPGLLVHTYAFVENYLHTDSLLERYWQVD